MNRPQYYVGIDIASATFTSAIGVMGEKWQIVAKAMTFDNTYDSFPKYLKWLRDHSITAENSVLCMEATGVYNEVLTHFLVVNHYVVSIEPPLKVKRAFTPEGSKSDAVDSGQVAEYACRFWDELSVWKPRQETLEQIKTLLTEREQFVVEKTGHVNALKALNRKQVRTPLAESLHQSAKSYLEGVIAQIEAEIRRLIDQDPSHRHLVGLMISIPGVGLLLAAHLLVAMQASPQPVSPKKLVVFIGICPYEHSSGSSVHHVPTSRHYGPSGLRKVLFLAALSLRAHNDAYKLYFARKVKEGKPPKLVINNIQNRLLKIIVAVVRSDTPFTKDYHSVNPGLLKKALT
jgi:transposase